MDSSRNILNNSNIGAVTNTGGGVAVNAVTTDTVQTITASKAFMSSQTFNSDIIGSVTSKLYINQVNLNGTNPNLFVNNVPVDSSILSNNPQLVKTTGDFSLLGNINLQDVNISGAFTTANITGSDIFVSNINLLDGLQYTKLNSTHLTDHDKILRTDRDDTITGKIDFTQTPTVNDVNILTEQNIATLVLNSNTTQAPSNSVIQSGANLFTEASPAPICVTDSQARIDSYYLYSDKFIPYVMGYNDLAKPNPYAHGLVGAGDSNHQQQFLRKDGQWAQASVTYSGTVSQILTDMRDYPSNYTGSDGKFLKVSFGNQHPDGSGVEFVDLSTNVTPVITHWVQSDVMA